jgi:hypothetical protein
MTYPYMQSVGYDLVWRPIELYINPLGGDVHFGDENHPVTLYIEGDPLKIEHLDFDDFPDHDPGPGSKRQWYDPSDGNRVKFSP